MTLIEVHVNEDQSELEQLVRDAYSSIGYPVTLPSFRFGRVILGSAACFSRWRFPSNVKIGFSACGACQQTGLEFRLVLCEVRFLLLRLKPSANRQPASRKVEDVGESI
jgi:hypothetical protein